MTHEHDDAGEDVLAGIDLRVWRVPPPAPLDRPALLGRALSPIGAPAKRRRIAWILAAVVLVNAAIAMLLVIVLAPTPTQRTVVVEPAGGGSVDAQVREILERLEQEQREVERKLAEIQELRALVLELSEKVRRYEQDEKRDRRPPKQRDRQPPDPVDRRPVDPFDAGAPSPGSCDEVGCVLTNYQDACCARFRSPRAPSANPSSSADDLPDQLDRAAITKAIASVRARVAACANRSTAKGKVKVRIRVEPRGQVSQVVIEATPDPALGACVAGAVRSALFPRTRNGGSFTYPFVF
jgi:outer membrane biosynthesis protein TonB